MAVEASGALVLNDVLAVRDGGSARQMPWWGLGGMTGDHADNCGYSGLKRDLNDFNPGEVYTGLLAKLEHSFIFTPHRKNCNAIGFHNHHLN